MVVKLAILDDILSEDITYLAILAERRQEAFAAAANAIDRLKRELHDVEK